MKYGELSPNKSINATIYRCFEHIHESDQRKFVRRFCNPKASDHQLKDTYRELIVGAYLATRGFEVEYERLFGKKRPDWYICGSDPQTEAILEVANLHPDRETECKIDADMRAERATGYWGSPRDKRLDQSIQEKVVKYGGLLESYNLACVVAVFRVFTTDLTLEAVRTILGKVEQPLFKQYRQLSGVLYFEEPLYRFQYSKSL